MWTMQEQQQTGFNQQNLHFLEKKLLSTTYSFCSTSGHREDNVMTNFYIQVSTSPQK